MRRKDQNGPINPRSWGIQTITSGLLTKGCDLGKRMSRLDYCLVIFSPIQLVQYTFFDKSSAKITKSEGVDPRSNTV